MRVAAHVDRKLSELNVATQLPAAQLAVLAAVNATDDMMKSRDEITRLNRELDALRTECEDLKEQLAQRNRALARMELKNAGV